MATKKQKPKASYHHGNLERAMVSAAVEIIRKEGLSALTLRGVGSTLGVSRSALYRHFADKEALLARVSLEGFRGLKEALKQSYEAQGKAAESCLPDMSAAYVEWAVANPSHYAVMFGAPMQSLTEYSELMQVAGESFRELLDAILERQRAGHLAGQAALPIAHSIWSLVHGVATLSIDCLLEGPAKDADAPELKASELASFACAAMLRGVESEQVRDSRHDLGQQVLNSHAG